MPRSTPKFQLVEDPERGLVCTNGNPRRDSWGFASRAEAEYEVRLQNDELKPGDEGFAGGVKIPGLNA